MPPPVESQLPGRYGTRSAASQVSASSPCLWRAIHLSRTNGGDPRAVHAPAQPRGARPASDVVRLTSANVDRLGSSPLGSVWSFKATRPGVVLVRCWDQRARVSVVPTRDWSPGIRFDGGAQAPRFPGPSPEHWCPRNASQIAPHFPHRQSPGEGHQDWTGGRQVGLSFGRREDGNYEEFDELLGNVATIAGVALPKRATS